MRRSILIVLAVAGLSVSGCGSESPAQRLTATCDEVGHKLLAMDSKLRPYPSPMGKLIEENVEGVDKSDAATTASVRRMPASAHTRQALADLARSRAEAEAILRIIKREGVASSPERALTTAPP